MSYLLCFLEGILSFVSPCLLPMLPVYLSYFAGGETGRGRVARGAAGFLAGFTLIFTALGALAGTLGGFFRQHQGAVNLVCGLAIVLFGLGYLGLIRLPQRGARRTVQPRGFFAAVLFGAVFALSWTPCVGAFLGSALMLASQQGRTLTGTLLLLCYSLGLGLPFVLSALLIDRLRGALDFLKRHSLLISRLSGGLLVAMGLLMMTGLLGRLLTALS